MANLVQDEVPHLVCWVCGEDFKDIKDIHYSCKSSAQWQKESFLIPNKFLDTDTSRQQVYRCVQALNKFNDEELYSVKTFVEEKGLRVFRVEER